MFKIFATLEPLPPKTPLGIYPIVFEYSPKFKRNLWELKDVPGHSEIKIHNGNTATDTDGCALIGMKHGTLQGHPAVLSSRLALQLFHSAMAPYEHTKNTIEVIDLIGD